jgi:Type II secretion system (T2SS), protein E, N-terminal domain
VSGRHRSGPLRTWLTADSRRQLDADHRFVKMTTLPAQLGAAGAFGDTPVTQERPRLGELLLRKGFIDETQLAWALEEAKRTKQMLGVVLLSQRLIFEDELARTLSQQLSLPYINIRQVGVDAAAARLLPAEVGAAAAAIPIRVCSDGVQVGFGDPTDDQALNAVTEHLPRISIAVAEVSEIKRAWQELTRR